MCINEWKPRKIEEQQLKIYYTRIGQKKNQQQGDRSVHTAEATKSV